MTTTSLMLDTQITGEVLGWLCLKPRPRLIGKTCQSDQRACMRPVWGHGRVDGDFFGLCSRCWYEHVAFHSVYALFRANPAAAKLDGTAIQRLTFGDQFDSDNDWTAPYDW